MLTNEDLNWLIKDPQDYLGQVKDIRDSIQKNVDLLNQYRALAVSTSSRQSDTGFGQGFSSSKIENCTVKRLELECAIQQQSQKLQQAQIKIADVCRAMIADSLNRVLIYEHYALLKDWKTLAKELGITRRAIYKRQEKFLQEISQKACTFTQSCDNI